MGPNGLIGVLLMVLALALSGCARPPPLAAAPGVEITPLRTISPLEGRILARLAGLKGMPVAHAADCYRMTYTALDAAGRPVRLTGLLALPRGVAARRLASFQHGTATSRDAVPSKPDGTGLAAAILFAGNGYAVVAPDYPGMGGSPGRHPYYVADEIGPAVVGMVDAARKVPGVPQGPVFLSGFSEGGWASMAALRLLEDRGERVLAAAPVAGAYDLRRMSLPVALQGEARSHSLYLAYAAWGQADHYGHRLDSLLTPQMAATVERLFAGAKPKEILETLPADPRQLFNPQFLTAYEQDGDHWFLQTFAANSLTEVTPRAPVRMYYGTKDTDVSPREALSASHGMRARGADVTAIAVGPVGHDASMLAAAPLILAWLKDLDRLAD